MTLTPAIICALSGLVLGFCSGCSGIVRGIICGLVITVDAGIVTGSISLMALSGIAFAVGCAIGVYLPAHTWLKHEFDVRQDLRPFK